MLETLCYLLIITFLIVGSVLCLVWLRLPGHHFFRSAKLPLWSATISTQTVLYLLYLSGPVALLHYHRPVIRAILDRTTLNLAPDSGYFAAWAANTSAHAPIILNLTFFEVLNPEQLRDPALHSRPLRVRESPPFTFHQRSYKSVGNYSADRRTLFFYESNVYVLDPRTDPAALDRPMVVPNFPLVALLAQVQRFNGVHNYMPLMPLIGGTILDTYSVAGLNRILAASNESLFIKVTARELIFGYQVRLGQYISELIDAITGSGGGSSSAKSETSEKHSGEKFSRWFRPKNQSMADKRKRSASDKANQLSELEAAAATSSPSPQTSPKETAKPRIGNFSLFNLINGTRNGPYEIYTGLNGTRSVGSQLRSYQGQTRLDLWRRERCNLVNGSDMLAWPGVMDHVHSVRIFAAAACRSFDLAYSGDVWYKGLSTRRYVIDDRELLPPNLYPPNKCYCTSDTSCSSVKDGGGGGGGGYFDLSACYDGIPVAASRAYFNPPRSRVEYTTKPLNVEDTQLLVHPLLGTTLHGRVNLQMSLRLSNESQFDLVRHSLNAAYHVPFVHFWKAIHVDDRTAERLRAIDYCLRLFRWSLMAAILVVVAAGLRSLWSSPLGRNSRRSHEFRHL